MSELASDLDELDQLLLDQGEDWMLLTQLDGYLAGILVSPDLVPPGVWLKHIWAGDDGAGLPHFEKMEEFQHIIDLIMRHYNDVLASLAQPGCYEPLFDIDTRNDDILWELWIEGFVQAMGLAPDGWERIAVSGNAGCKAALKGMAKLHAIANGEAQLSHGKVEQWTREAPDLIPIWVETLHAWRLENDPSRPWPPRQGKVGRNDPCPCGSGKKYKRCCGLN
ncbi:MAG: YecA family protein [Novosphingobium sp.]|nr:YecA family protein [Novosphingobium sp.]|tara:strand:+ start:83 stop:748 length:666 start_codon:yes stop_codon:yes gene_type:complete